MARPSSTAVLDRGFMRLPVPTGIFVCMLVTISGFTTDSNQLPINDACENVLADAATNQFFVQLSVAIGGRIGRRAF